MRRLRLKNNILLAACLTAAFLFPSHSFAKVLNGKNVLIVNSYHPEYLWAQLVNSGIVAALTGQRYSSYISKEFLDNVGEFDDSILWMKSKFLTSDEEKRKAARPIIKAIEART